MGGDPHTETTQRGVSLGVEGGATRTVALFADSGGRLLKRLETRPLNLKLASDNDILDVLRELRIPRLTIQNIAICLAGCRTERDRARVRELAARLWPRARCVAGSDLDSGFAAACGVTGAGILVVSGTGSCVCGRNGEKSAQAGGWGHLLGDRGSGYWIALQNLRAAVRHYDRSGTTSRGLQKILRRLCLNCPDELVDWIQRAKKGEIAALADELFDENPAVLSEAAADLAADCAAVAKTLQLSAPNVVLTGGVFAHHPKFYKLTARKIQKLLPNACIRRPKFESASGALLLAQVVTLSEAKGLAPRREILRFAQNDRTATLASALTEQRNARTMDLHTRSISQLIDTMLAGEKRVIPALQKQKRAIELAIRSIVRAFRRGGRLFYVGAGTSGRLGVLDASECPPTFSTDPDMVQGIIAGGSSALHSALEAAEDDPRAGAVAIRHRGVNGKDVVVGIAASGSTPFVLGALDEAKRRRAQTFLLCFSEPGTTRHTPIVIRTGPEILTGSTRLKAGTATKLVLNMLTTISMIRLGKVVSNLMVDVKPNSQKLRDRACRIVSTLANCTVDEAHARLVRAKWNVKRALR